MTDIISWILETFDEEILAPEAGTGRHRDRLYRGLESVLRRARVPPKTQSDEMRELYDKLMDYDALLESSKAIDPIIKNPSTAVTRMQTILLEYGVETYGELVAFFNSQTIMDKTRQLPSGGYRKIRTLSIGKGLGPKSCRILYHHLNSIGIQLFDKPYRPHEIGEKRYSPKK